ncbi:MAG: choice-of-anchor L domain-containing protein [Crocinitomicaceae bacterium]
MSFAIKNICILVCSLLAVGTSYGQLITSTALTPTQLVQNILVGSGVTVSNVSYSGGADAIGSFDGNTTNLGLGTGILLTTGTVNSGTGLFGAQQGPHGPNNLASAGMDNGAAGYPQLTAIAGEDTYNATILEFDFVPNSDSVSFRYVFASEEYPEFVNQGYNDIFAFFITGPGFGGAYNMATIPGTANTPVTIDNVNATTNSSFFVNNGNGSSAPQNGSSFYIQYDGFTTVIEAKAEVQCGEIYHLKLAIADVGDPSFDSGIFLEANSLTSPKPVEISSSLAKNVFNNIYELAEGCETATITVERNAAQSSQALSIPLSTAGTATEGVDYSSVPTSVNFAAGQSVVTFTIDVFADNIAEGSETLKLILDQPDPCGNSNLIELDLLIREVLPLTVSLADETIQCSGDQVNLMPTVTGGVEPYSYNWSTGQSTQSITLNPSTTTPISVTVADDCNSAPQTANSTVTVPVYAPYVLATTSDTAVLCPNTPITLAANVQGGSGADIYTWEVNGGFVSNSQNLNVSPFSTTTYTVTVENLCGEILTDQVTVTVLTDVLTVATIDEVLICKGDEVEIWAKGLGGLGNFNYFWPHSGETSSNITVKPERTTTYNVYVADDCGTYVIEGKVTVKILTPRANFGVISSNLTEGLPIQFQNTSVGATSWEWDLGNGQFSTAIVPTAVYSLPGVYEVQQIAISDAGCRDSITKSIHIRPAFYFYAPNAFTLNGDRYNSTYKVSVIGETAFHFTVYNRWGELVFESFDPNFEWDGFYGGKEVPFGVYVYKVWIADLEEKRHSFEGFITVLK